MKRSDYAVIIPARYNSTRFPGKPLADIHGKSMLIRMYNIASAVCDRVIVATDDDRIYKHVKNFSKPGDVIEIVYSEEHFNNGTERCADVVRTIEENTKVRQLPNIIVNLQCDMPYMPPRLINLTVDAVMRTRTISTLYFESEEVEEFEDPNNVKIVASEYGNALYFSRSLIPYPGGRFSSFKKHIGIYGYLKKELLHIDSLLRSSNPELFGMENLEQNIWLSRGIPIVLQKSSQDVKSVNVPDDISYELLSNL